MFDSVMTQGPGGRLGSGALISITLHAAAITAALVFPAVRAVKEQARTVPPLVVFTPKSELGRGTSTTIEARHQAPRRHSHRTVVQPRTLAPTAAPASPAPIANDEDVPDSDEGSDGPPTGERIGTGPVSGVEGGSAHGSGDFTVWGPGMTQPELISGQDPEYTREALEARVEGTAIARCVLTIEGRAQQCRVLKPLPFLSDAVLRSLETRRYRPVTFDGKPVAVEYVFYFRFKLPR